MNRFAYLVAGAALATTLVLSCSDDSPPAVDAAVCDCPAAEPPIPPRIMIVRGTNISAPVGNGVSSAECSIGAKVLGGGCFLDEGSAGDITVSGFGKVEGQEAFFCRWRNNHVEALTVYAEATCLVP